MPLESSREKICAHKEKDPVDLPLGPLKMMNTPLFSFYSDALFDSEPKSFSAIAGIDATDSNLALGTTR